MPALAFDTLRAAGELEAAGLERPAAEAVASSIRDGHRELATKWDIQTLQRVVWAHLAIGLVTLAGVLATTFQ